MIYVNFRNAVDFPVEALTTNFMCTEINKVMY